MMVSISSATSAGRKPHPRQAIPSRKEIRLGAEVALDVEARSKEGGRLGNDSDSRGLASKAKASLPAPSAIAVESSREKGRVLSFDSGQSELFFRHPLTASLEGDGGNKKAPV